MAIYFCFGLSIRTFEVSVISVATFLIACLVFLNIEGHAKRTKTLVIRHLGY